MNESALKIALWTGCLITAITLSLTCLLTIQAVIAYIKETGRSAGVHDAGLETIVPISYTARSRSTDMPPQTDTVTPRRAVGLAPRRAAAVMPPSAPSAAEAKQVGTAAAETLLAPTPESGSQAGVADPASPSQHHEATAGEPPSLGDGMRPSMADQQQCGGGFWQGTICREVIRWSSCHPDKWGTTAECAIQHFSDPMQ